MGQLLGSGVVKRVAAANGIGVGAKHRGATADRRRGARETRGGSALTQTSSLRVVVFLHDLHRLQWFDHRDAGPERGWRSIHLTDGDHPYMKHWWVPGLQIGYEHTFIHQFADFLSAAAGGQSTAPTFRDGLATDYVTDAILKSAKTGRWEKVAATQQATV